MFPDLYLIRHGETEWNVAGRMQGWRDSPLTAKGRAQMEALAPRLREIGAARAFSSPQGRALASARLALPGRAVTPDARLREISLGPWDGSPFETLHAAHPGIFDGRRLDWYDRVPGGEGLAALRARVTAFLAELDGPAIVVTHGITLRMIRAVATGADWHAGEVVQGAVHHVPGAAS